MSDVTPAPGISFAELFGDEDYRHHLRLDRSDPARFFAPTPARASRLAERARWLTSHPNRHALFRPEAAPLLDEFIDLGLVWGTFGNDAPARTGAPGYPELIQAGVACELDFLLLDAGADRFPNFVGGCVCFPSSWAPEDKLGLPLPEIHDVVPGLNQALGGAISGFLSRLRPGIAWLRANWGLSRSPELNQHPARGLSRLSPTVAPDEVWLRVEQQALIALPASRGVLFGIRIETSALPAILAQPEVALGLARALRTMPQAMADYKNITPVRYPLADWLVANASHPVIEKDI